MGKEDFFEGLEPEPQDEELRAKHRLLFSSGIGLEVLADILTRHCHFGSYLDPEDKARIGQYNVGIAILGMMKKEKGPIDPVKLLNALL